MQLTIGDRNRESREKGEEWAKVSMGEEVKFKWPDVLKTMGICIVSWLGNIS